MGQKEKLILRLKSKPKDFTFDELETLLSYLGYKQSDKGRTSGSRVSFYNPEHGHILIHKPHSRKALLITQVKQILNQLDKEGLI